MQGLKTETKTTVRQVLSVDDVAEHFDVTSRTIWNWVAAHEFPAPLRVGRRMRYWSAEVIDEWIEAGCPKVGRDD